MQVKFFYISSYAPLVFQVQGLLACWSSWLKAMAVKFSWPSGRLICYIGINSCQLIAPDREW